MQPNPNAGGQPAAAEPVLPAEPVLEVLDDLVPAELNRAAWAACSGKGWYFGHGSNAGDWGRFWKLDLDGDAALDAIWERLRPRCEALAGATLRVVRQYANGHTYGLGGNPHLDDYRPGTFTLLYYPNPEWKDNWEGETVFLDRSGEISFAVRPRPGRVVFFDSRIPHAGRAPSRLCPALRVTVAYKLETIPASGEESVMERRVRSMVVDGPVQSDPVTIEEIRRDGPERVYRLRIASEIVDGAVRDHLAELAKSVRIPGFRAGRIPEDVLNQRYGNHARRDILNRLGAEAIGRLLPKTDVASAMELKSGKESGDVEIQISATCLSDLPPIDFSQVALELPVAAGAQLDSAGVTREDAELHFRGYLNLQALDRLDREYRFSLLPIIVEREFALIWKAAQSQLEIAPDEVAQKSIEFRAIAERRLRLGLVVAELARRFQIQEKTGAELEAAVMNRLIAESQVRERPATEQELLELKRASRG